MIDPVAALATGRPITLQEDGKTVLLPIPPATKYNPETGELNVSTAEQGFQISDLEVMQANEVAALAASQARVDAWKQIIDTVKPAAEATATTVQKPSLLQQFVNLFRF